MVIEEDENKYGQKQKILAKKKIKLLGKVIEVRIIKTQRYYNPNKWVILPRARWVK